MKVAVFFVLEVIFLHLTFKRFCIYYHIELVKTSND